jgi:hypothetical protein
LEAVLVGWESASGGSGIDYIRELNVLNFTATKTLSVSPFTVSEVLLSDFYITATTTSSNTVINVFNNTGETIRYKHSVSLRFWNDF